MRCWRTLARVTAAELGLITTATVGVFAVIGPFVTGWAQRSHESTLTREGARREVYRDVGAYLERQRLMLTRAGVPEPYREPPPEDLSDAEYSALFGRAAVEGSTRVHKKLDEYAKAAHRFLGIVMTFEGLESRRTPTDVPAGWAEASDSVDKARELAIAALDAVEEAMRRELVGSRYR
jgi:hypothetical protein